MCITKVPINIRIYELRKWGFFSFCVGGPQIEAADGDIRNRMRTCSTCPGWALPVSGFAVDGRQSGRRHETITSGARRCEVSVLKRWVLHDMPIVQLLRSDVYKKSILLRHQSAILRTVLKSIALSFNLKRTSFRHPCFEEIIIFAQV